MTTRKWTSALGFVVLSTMIGVSLAPRTVAASLEDKKQEDFQADHLKPSIANLNSSCGTSIDVQIDFASWEASPEKFGNGAGGPATYGVCAAAIESTRQVCSEKNGKDAIKKQVKKFVCKGGQPEQATVNLSADGTLTYAASIQIKHNVNVHDYLMKTLK